MTSIKATCVMTGTAGVQGTVIFTQHAPGQPVTIHVKITGLAAGKHGFHVHAFGDTTNGCISAGPHFNPKGVDHAGPEDIIRHVGDLGNVVADGSGTTDYTFTDSVISLSGPNSIIGRAMVIHELEDDLGLGGHELSKTTGNAGGRLACGVIGLAQS